MNGRSSQLTHMCVNAKKGTTLKHNAYNETYCDAGLYLLNMQIYNCLFKHVFSRQNRTGIPRINILFWQASIHFMTYFENHRLVYIVFIKHCFNQK